MRIAKPRISEIQKREKNKKLLFIYAMAKRDLNNAQRFLEKSLDHTQDVNERDAILITLFITYGRIFAKNFDLPRINLKDLQCHLTDDEKAFHESLITLRNKIFAHSDASMNNIQVFLNDKNELDTVSSHNTTLIDYPEIARELFAKMLNAVEIKLKSLLVNLYSQENGYKITDKNFVLLGYSNNFGNVRISTKA